MFLVFFRVKDFINWKIFNIVIIIYNGLISYKICLEYLRWSGKILLGGDKL